MYKLKAVRVWTMPVLLIAIAACTAPGVVGDQGAPLMRPGLGLVANSVIFRSPNSDPNLKFGHKSTIFHFTYRDVGDPNNEFLVSNGRDSAVVESKAPRSADEDGNPTLVLSPAKPGIYRLHEVRVIPYPYNNPFTFLALNPPPLTVVAGQVAYAGSLQLLTGTRWVGGTLTPSTMVLDTVDDFATDIGELKTIEPRLRSVTIKNALKN